jgi:hypothetical protein
MHRKNNLHLMLVTLIHAHNKKFMKIVLFIWWDQLQVVIMELCSPMGKQDVVKHTQ